jgi:hypothetical protein
VLPRTDYKLGHLRLQIGVVFVWKRHLGSVLHLLVVLCEKGMVDGGGGRSKSGSSNEFLKNY